MSRRRAGYLWNTRIIGGTTAAMAAALFGAEAACCRGHNSSSSYGSTARGRVLSLSPNLDPSRQATRSYRLVFKGLVKEVSATLTEAERRDLAGEVERVTEWFDQRESPALGLILFSCTPRDLWLTYFVNAPVRDHLAFEVRPDVAALLELVDHYERFAVALVSKDKARLFTVFAGTIEETIAFEDVVPGKTDGGGLKQSKIQRHHELHVLWHLKKVVASLSNLRSRHDFDRLILMGPVEATSELPEILPHVLKARVATVLRDFSHQIEGRAVEQSARVEVVHGVAADR